MSEVLQVADRIAVLYLGRMAAQVRRSEVNQQQLVELITTGGSEDVNLAATNGATA
jgi:D-xylose transport system ATP-binding protein